MWGSIGGIMRKLMMAATLALMAAAAMAADRVKPGNSALDSLSGITIGIVGGVAALPSIPQPESGTDRIVGGVEAEKNEFSFIVSLQNSTGFPFCGGSLIKKDWVLTAAHCFGPVAPKLKFVVAGLHEQNQPQGAEKFEVDKVIVHPNYNKAVARDYDFALVHLKGSSKSVPITLNETEIPDNTDFVAAGWGCTVEGGSGSDILRKVTVPLVPESVCSEAYAKYKYTITDRMICAGLAEGGKDSCQGDSGGPLIMGSRGSLAGVVSWGVGCGDPNQYGVYSKVSSVIPWIESVTK